MPEYDPGIKDDPWNREPGMGRTEYSAGGLPPHLANHRTWATQFLLQNGRWPTQEELTDTLDRWWNTVGEGVPQGRTNYIGTGNVREAADYFAQNHGGRMPGLAEMPQALAEFAAGRTGTGALPEPVGEPGEAPGQSQRPRAAGLVTSELGPLLQGAGRDIFQGLAGNTMYDFARYNTGGQGALSYYDYLRSLSQRLIGGGNAPLSIARNAAPLTWEGASAAGAPEALNTEPMQNAVIGSWLAQFAPQATGALRGSLVNRLQDLQDQYPYVAEGGSRERFADYLGRMMQGYL